MKKSLIALAVAGAVAAPTAMADVTLYGTVSVDYVHENNAGTNTAGLERDDNIIGVKASSELDNGMTVSAEIRIDSGQDITTPDRGYLAVEGGYGKLWFGKFGSPLDVVDTPLVDNQENVEHIADELDNAIGYTSPSFGGLDFYAGFSATKAAAGTDPSTTGADAVIYGVNFNAAGFSANIGAAATENPDDIGNDLDQLGIHLGYAADSFSIGIFQVKTDEEADVAADEVETTSTGIKGTYTFNNTSLMAYYVEDDYDEGVGGTDYENETWALKVTQNLGGGLKVYGSYSDLSAGEAGVSDSDTLNLGISYSF